MKDITSWPLKKFEDFARSSDWSELPFTIRLAMIHVWRAEQDIRRASRQRKCAVE